MPEIVGAYRRKADAASAQRWQVRVNYYEHLILNVMTLLEDVKILIAKEDHMPGVLNSLGRVLRELEDTWGLLALEKSEEMAGRTKETLPARSDHDLEVEL